MKPSAALESNRGANRRVVEAHRARNARVFGSALTGEDDSSDLDLLIDPTPKTPDCSRWDIKMYSRLYKFPVNILTEPRAERVYSRLYIFHPARPEGGRVYSRLYKIAQAPAVQPPGARLYSRLNENSHPKPRPERGFPRLDVQL